MNILDIIVKRKHEEVYSDKQSTPIYSLMEQSLFKRKCFSAKESISREGASGLIAEFKRKSPSKGVINNNVDPVNVLNKYQEAGVSMVSVLTDKDFFGARADDFSKAREVLNIPLLRKDFIVDPYQIYQAKAMGADVILLIAAILSPQRCKDFAFLAHQLGMEVLLELHTKDELLHVNKFVDLIGVNNRNLKDFTVNTQRSVEMLKLLPKEMICVAESGLSSVNDLLEMRKSGFKAFLMGEYFMKNENPGDICLEFTKEIGNEN